MNAMTYEEVLEFEKKHQWATGLSIDENWRGLYYDNAEANCIELKFPDTPMQVPYFTRVLSLLNTDSEEHFNGALLWLTLWDIGSPQLEKIGWKLVEKMRLGFGETRPIGVAPGQWFRSDEFVELNAFLLPCFIFGWDAYLAPSGKDYFVHISHDEFWIVVTKTAAVHKELWEQLKSLDPKPAHPPNFGTILPPQFVVRRIAIPLELDNCCKQAFTPTTPVNKCNGFGRQKRKLMGNQCGPFRNRC